MQDVCLLRVPVSLLRSSEVTTGAKMLYGLLRGYGDKPCSAVQASLILGVSERGVRKCLKELKCKGLIETYIKELGGTNHYRFPR